MGRRNDGPMERLVEGAIGSPRHVPAAGVHRVPICQVRPPIGAIWFGTMRLFVFRGGWTVLERRDHRKAHRLFKTLESIERKMIGQESMHTKRFQWCGTVLEVQRERF